MKFSRNALFLALSMGATCVLADTGGLRIKVVDHSGQPLNGVTVHASTSESLTTKSGTTDESGEVRIVGLDPSAKYEIKVSGEGYQPILNKGVLVVSDKIFNLNYTLSAAGSDIEEVNVVGRLVQLVDTTSATVGQDITLDLTESLPTGRSYQSYLQLAPGTKPSISGNPSSKSGVNYSDAVDSQGRTTGASTDNLYFIDGINVTDPQTGTFGANVNSEIIQEQSVLTGGIPAEYEGGAGLVSKVITKSGSNEWSGSLNYYTQNDSLVAKNKHIESNSFSTFDTAFTLGGPLIEDKLWFYSSYQIKERSDDVGNPETGDLMRTVDTEENLGFLKFTWQATDNDKFSLSYFNDPYERSGSDDPTVLNNRDTARQQGGDNYIFQYSHSWDDVILTVDASSHEGELSTIPADTSTRNDVAFLTGNPTAADLDQGGYGSSSIQFRNRESYGITAEWFLDTNYGSHNIKGGIRRTENTRELDFFYTGDGAQYTSINANDAGATLDDYTNLDWTGETDITTDDYARIISAMQSSADSAYYIGLLDTDNSGDISNAELGAMTFDSTSGNPTGMANAYRINMVETAPVEFKTEGLAFFIQDSWNYENWTVNAGIRMEQWDHYATDGSKIFTFDAEIAPRLSVVYDINGDGTSKVWGFMGRYYDPIRTDMTSFAGTLTGPVRDEQVFVGDRWLTFRTRGGSQTQDAYFAPTTKTPYTDEILIGYSKSLTSDISVEATYTKRITKDILEDYDLGLYTDAATAGDFYLPLSYFGYSTMPDSNYVIGTLAGGEREYQGVEFTFRKRRSDNWQMLASYTYNDATGNSNSDGNADFQGDVFWLDPRAPGMDGKQPGNVEHLFKIAGSYFWDNGLELGVVYNWNSGARYSETWAVSGRHLPVRVDTAYEYGGVTTRWVDENAVGKNEGTSYGTLDMRLKYTMDFAAGYQAELFLDVFNVLDDQAAVRRQDLAAGDGIYDYQEAVEWVAPRRLYLGARVSF